MAIRFGTSGWRAIMADQFTFTNVRSVTPAICEEMKPGEACEGSVASLPAKLHTSRRTGVGGASRARTALAESDLLTKTARGS